MDIHWVRVPTTDSNFLAVNPDVVKSLGAGTGLGSGQSPPLQSYCEPSGSDVSPHPGPLCRLSQAKLWAVLSPRKENLRPSWSGLERRADGTCCSCSLACAAPDISATHTHRWKLALQKVCSSTTIVISGVDLACSQVFPYLSYSHPCAVMYTAAYISLVRHV